MLWQTPVVIPTRHKDHVIAQILPLYFRLLEANDICLENIEHPLECSPVSPWLIPEWIAYAVDVPGSDPDAHGGGYGGLHLIVTPSHASTLHLGSSNKPKIPPTRTSDQGFDRHFQTRRPRAARDLAARLSLIFPYWAINWSELCRTSPHTTTSNTYDAPSYTAHTMSLPRLAQRFAQRSPTLRTTIQRRFESQVTISSASDKLPLPGKKLTGAADNAFNRERAAVKAHAAATSGISLPSAASRSSIANL